MQRVLPYFVVAVFMAALAVAVAPTLTTKLGLDLIGGLRGEYQVVATDQQPVTPDILAKTRDIIEARVNATGAVEPIVQTQGSDRVSVELPGAVNAEEIRRLIGTTGRLDFIGMGSYAGAITEGAPLPTDSISQQQYLFSGDQIQAARPGQDPVGQPAVDVELKETGANLFDDYAANHLHDRVAIVLDGKVISAPELQTTRFGGNMQISGNFTIDSMNSLVTVLRFGSLPLEIVEVGFSGLSATLGRDFLYQTLLGGVIGIALVFAFMLLHYRLPGVIACIALLFYALINYALFRMIPVTLTLAGIAGFVLSVGMAVDANILIFERTKEELRAGKNLNAAIEAGFNRAWNSIFDSNVSTLMTAGILWYFGTSVVRGFALVLILGVLTSMFTAITMSRMMLRWVVRQPWARKASYFGVRDDEFMVAQPARPTRTREAGVRV
jgi:preprotein translocase subunit SecD